MHVHCTCTHTVPPFQLTPSPLPSSSLLSPPPLLTPPLPPPLPLQEKKSSVWTEHKAPDGRLYYYNSETKQSSWQKPDDLMTRAEVSPLVGGCGLLDRCTVEPL